MKKLLLLGAITFGIFLIPSFSFAANYVTNDQSTGSDISCGGGTGAPYCGSAGLYSGASLPTSTGMNFIMAVYLATDTTSGWSAPMNLNFSTDATGGGLTGGAFCTGVFAYYNPTLHYVAYTCSGLPLNLQNGNYYMILPGGDGTYRGEATTPVPFDGTGIWGGLFDTTSSADAFFASGGGGGSPAINFLYPQNGTATLDFQNWVINVSTTASSTFGNVYVYYGMSSSTLNFVDQAQFSAFVSSDPFIIPKSHLLNYIVNLTATSSWYAQTCYAGVNFSSTCSSVINFILDPRAPVNNSTSALPALQFNNSADSYTPASSSISSTLAQNPYSCQGNLLNFSVSNCFNYFLFSFAQVLFQPTVGAQAYLQNSVSNFQQVPPFKSVFDTFNGVSSTLGSPPSSQDLVNSSFNFGSAASGTPIVFLSSSTLSQAITPAGKAYLFDLEDAVFLLLDLGLIFYVPWHWWKHKQSTQTK
jgi:hypothetical protein